MTKQGVPVNTASRIKNVPRTTLRKALEMLCAKGNVVKVTGKNRRYEVECLGLAAETSSNPASAEQEEVVESENLQMEIEPEVDTVKPTMVKSKF